MPKESSPFPSSSDPDWESCGCAADEGFDKLLAKPLGLLITSFNYISVRRMLCPTAQKELAVRFVRELTAEMGTGWLERLAEEARADQLSARRKDD